MSLSQRWVAAPGGQDGEVGKAQQAAAAGEEAGGQPTIFSKIIARSVPATILYEDDKVVGTAGRRGQPGGSTRGYVAHLVPLPPAVPGFPRRGPSSPRPLLGDP